MTKTAGTETALTTAIDNSYLQPLEPPRAGYPALQASKYKNLAEDSTIRLGLGTNAIDLLGADTLAKLYPEIISVKFGAEEEMFYVPHSRIRWIPLHFPKKYIEDFSGERRVYRPIGGDWNDKCKSVCRLFLAAVDGDELVTDEQGDPAVFSLTLRGLKTHRITGKEGSLLSLNAALCKRHGVTTPSYMGHLVGMEITCKVSEFPSAADSSKTSLGADYVFAKASLLPPAIQAATTALVREDSRLMAAIADPFGIGASSPALLEDGDYLF
jgi:hypothetical protein